MLQRYYGLPLGRAGLCSAAIIGATGIIGLVVGGWIADRVHQRSAHGRMVMGTFSMALSGFASWCALSADQTSIALFAGAFAVAWFLQYQYYTCVYPVIQDVVAPKHRARVMAIYFACLYVLGAAFGPIMVGRLSDHFADLAMRAAGSTEISPQFRASGLHEAMYLVPVTLGMTAVLLLLAARTFREDARPAVRRT